MYVFLLSKQKTCFTSQSIWSWVKQVYNSTQEITNSFSVDDSERSRKNLRTGAKETRMMLSSDGVVGADELFKLQKELTWSCWWQQVGFGTASWSSEKNLPFSELIFIIFLSFSSSGKWTWLAGKTCFQQMKGCIRLVVEFVQTQQKDLQNQP